MLSYRALLAFFLNMYQNTSICFTYQAYKATGVDFDTTTILGAVFSRRSSVNCCKVVFIKSTLLISSENAFNHVTAISTF